MQPDQQPDPQEPQAPAEATPVELKDCFPQLFTRFLPSRSTWSDPDRATEDELRQVLRQVRETSQMHEAVSRLLSELDMPNLKPPIRQTGFFQELLALRDLLNRAAQDGDRLAHEMAVQVVAGQLVQHLKEGAVMIRDTFKDGLTVKTPVPPAAPYQSGTGAIIGR